jgi:hypothetical protein
MQVTTQVGTLTDQGIFIGMEGNLAKFEKYVTSSSTMIIKCSPMIAKIISQQEENQRIADEHECRDMGIWYQAILRGSEARSAFSSFKESIAV